MRIAHTPTRYSYLTKVEPTSRALRLLGPAAWITGRRRSQGAQREKMQMVEKDAGKLGEGQGKSSFWDFHSHFWGIQKWMKG